MVIYKRSSSWVGKVPVKTTTLTVQTVFKLWPAQTFGHPRNMFLDFAKQSSTISKILYYIVFSAHVLREDMCSYSATNLGKALFSIFALALNLPEHFFDDKVCHMFSSNDASFSYTFDHRLNIQQSLWWSLYTILLKQAHLTSDRLALVPTRSKIQYSLLDNLISDSKFARLVAGRWLSFSWTRRCNIFSLIG